MTALQSSTSVVYVGADDGVLYAVNAATGEREWAFTGADGPVRSSPIFADGTVYVGADDGRLEAAAMEGCDTDSRDDIPNDGLCPIGARMNA